MRPSEGSGRVIANRYRLLDLIGTGGMGAVWRARDELLGVDVALKEVKIADGLHASERSERVTRAMREARNAARLRTNPHVVTVHDAVEDDGLPWIVMELVPSMSLTDAVVRDGPLPVPVVARLGLGVLDALTFGHASGVLHRDVKPSNILLADDGRVLLTDFGIATHETDPTITRSGSVGTPLYMAPERLAGGSATPSTDLYALGGTLFYALEGRAPFQRETAAESMGAAMFGEPHPLTRGGSITPLVLGLLAREPGSRPDQESVLVALTAASVEDSSAPPANFSGPPANLSKPPPPVPVPGTGTGTGTGSGGTGRTQWTGPPGTWPSGPGPSVPGPWGAGAPVGRPAPANSARWTLIGALVIGALVLLGLIAGGIALAVMSSGTGSSSSSGSTLAPTPSPAGPLTTGPASAPASTAPTSSGAIADLQVPAGYLGQWSGTVVQGTLSYKANVTITGGSVGTKIGTFVYPDPLLQCAGDLTLTGVTSSSLQVVGTLTQTGSCSPDTATVTLNPDGTLSYDYPAGPLNSAGHADLTKN